MKLEEMYDLSDFPYASLGFSAFHLNMEKFQDFCLPVPCKMCPLRPPFESSVTLSSAQCPLWDGSTLEQW